MEVQENGTSSNNESLVQESAHVAELHHNGITIEAVVDTSIVGTEEHEIDGSNGVSSSSETDLEEAPQPRIMKSVKGFDTRTNDVIYAPPLRLDGESDSLDDGDNDPTRANVLVYFGGDIQDTEEMMRANRDYKSCLHWNLENTAQVLQRQFPTHHIVIIRPARMHIYTYSCYDNFVPSNAATGHPEHTPCHHALQHLEILLRNASALVERSARLSGEEHKGPKGQHSKATHEEPVSSSASQSIDATNGNDQSEDLNPHLDRGNISLVGFSKGAVVLNQLIYEFHYLKTLTPDDRSMEGFLLSLKSMYWLDGGHSGGKNTWITSRSLLETLSRTGIRVHVHMTPFQLNDTRRPYIRREEKSFTDCLERSGAQIFRHVHFEKEAPTLETHFKVIAQFGLITPEFLDDSLDGNELPSISIFDS